MKTIYYILLILLFSIVNENQASKCKRRWRGRWTIEQCDPETDIKTYIKCCRCTKDFTVSDVNNICFNNNKRNTDFLPFCKCNVYNSYHPICLSYISACGKRFDIDTKRLGLTPWSGYQFITIGKQNIIIKCSDNLVWEFDKKIDCSEFENKTTTISTTLKKNIYYTTSTISANEKYLEKKRKLNYISMSIIIFGVLFIIVSTCVMYRYYIKVCIHSKILKSRKIKYYRNQTSSYPPPMYENLHEIRPPRYELPVISIPIDKDGSPPSYDELERRRLFLFTP